LIVTFSKLGIENPRVGGSIPPLATISTSNSSHFDSKCIFQN